jgi:hypothetical protein
MRSAKRTPLMVAMLLGVGSRLMATTFMQMSLSKFAQTARLIVRARCLSNSVAWDAGEIWTFTTFEIEETWKGVPAGAAAQVTVRLLGGSLGNVTSTVSGIPRFRPGEEVVLFLEPSVRGAFSIVSWAQGTFRIHRDMRTGQEIVIQDTAAFDRFNPGTRQFESVASSYQSIDYFRSQVRSAIISASTGGKK